MRKRTHRAHRQPIPKTAIWFPSAVDTICPECNAPVLSGVHQCQPKAV